MSKKAKPNTVYLRTVKLIASPYKEPALQVGDRTICLYRDCEVVITSWTDAPIPWPRCRAVHVRGGAGLLVNKELLRAIRTESAEALKHWFGVGTKAVWSWRKAFGIGHWGTKGSSRLHRLLSKAGAAVVRDQPLPAEQVELRRQRAIALNLGRYLKPGYHGRWWTAEEVALLGTMPDVKVAARIGRTVEAVRIKRTRRA